MTDKRKAMGKLLMEKTTDAMKAVAERYGLIAEDRIDLRGERIRFNHEWLDLRQFLLEGCDLSDSVLTNATGEGVNFRRCVLKRVRVMAERGKKVSFRGASFDEAIFDDATFGPRTLDLSQSSFRKTKLRKTTFSMGKLEEATFEEADLVDVYFRSGLLHRASFRGARLKRVSFESATLDGADFTGASFELMEHWGEPDYTGAIISDELRYRYGIVPQPLHRLDALIARGFFNDDELPLIRAFRDTNQRFLSNPNPMLIESEYDLPPALFIKMLKALKEEPVH